MTKDNAERQAAELLAVIGQVDPPAADALQDAREVLWTAAADEALSAAEAPGDAERIRARRTARSQRIARRRRTDPGS